MTDQPPTPGAFPDSLGLTPLTPWQQQVADALLRSGPIVLSIPRGQGRAAIARQVEAAQRPVENDIVFGGNACPDGCCRSIRSRSFPQPRGGAVYVRPMFQIIADHPLPDLDDEDGMRVDAAEYDRPDRIWL